MIEEKCFVGEDGQEVIIAGEYADLLLEQHRRPMITRRTWASGEVVTASEMNTYRADNIGFQPSRVIIWPQKELCRWCGEPYVSGKYTDIHGEYCSGCHGYKNESSCLG